MVEHCKSQNNKGICYSDLEKQDSTLFIYLQAVKIVETIDNIEIKLLIYKNTGDRYSVMKEPEKALPYLQKAEEIRIKEGNPYQLTTLYNSMGDVYQQLKQFDKALLYFKKSEKIAQEINSYQMIMKTYISLGEIYAITGNFKSSSEYYKKYILYKDTMMNENIQKQISDLETKYQTERKEQQINLQETEIEKQDAVISRNMTEKIGLGIIGVLFLLVGLVVFKRYRQKRKSVIIIEEKNTILEQANEEIKAQRDETEAQRDFANQQKELIEEQNTEIKDSISYAKRIQSVILPDEAHLKELFSDAFIFFQPKDIVSGDFYWWTQIENHSMIAVADCTGHGVPGAFMSMLGISLLPEIVQKEYIYHPGVILRKLRKEIIRSLRQTGISDEQKDGMDMAIISLDQETQTMQFADANNSLYIISDREIDGLEKQAGYNSFYEIKPDKMPIAIYERMDSFTTHEFKVQKGNQLYMFSDGFADQFGGENGKKYKYKPFKR